MPTTNAPAAPQTESRKGGRLPSRLLLCGTAAMILLTQATAGRLPPPIRPQSRSGESNCR